MIAPSGWTSPRKKRLSYSRVEHELEERQLVVPGGDEVLVEEREGDLVARAVDDEVGVDLAAVGEPDLVAVRATAMFGFVVIAPWASRSRIRPLTVGWACANLWSGSGSP